MTYLAIFVLCALSLILFFLLLRLRKKLDESQLRLSTFLESHPECIKTQDESGVVLSMNKAGLKLIEIDHASEIIGQTVYTFINEDYHNDYEKLSRNVFNGHNQIMEYQIRGRKGNECWLETHAVPLRNYSNQIVALLSSTRDITERKELQRKLQKRQMELEHVSKVSTMGEVASGIAHELNQPLCAISSLAETCVSVIETGDIENLSQMLKRISEQSIRASQIISWIRGLASRGEINPSLFDIKEMLIDIKSRLSYYLEPNKTILLLECDQEFAKLSADRIQLEHVFINLITNATEAMSHQSRKRKIRILVTVGQESNILVNVQDTGKGISEAHVNKLFNPYFTTKQNGLGMGLSICRSIISAHNGKIWVGRSNSFGTEINISIPKEQFIHNYQDQNYA